MDKNKFFKYLPYLAALVIFAVIACVYCAPVFEGKELYAGDNIHFKEAVRESIKYHEDTGNYTCSDIPSRLLIMNKAFRLAAE